MSPRSLILTTMTRLAYPLMLLAAGVLLLRGHNEPGGGFIAGMVAVSATALLAVAQGAERAQRALPLAPLPLAAAGTLLALLSGVPALLLGQAYMTHLWATLPLGITEYKLSTVLAFDLGVTFTVWGALGGLCAALIGIDEAEAAP